MENELNQVHKTKKRFQTFLSTDSFSQPVLLSWGNQRKNNNHMFRRFREQLLAET